MNKKILLLSLTALFLILAQDTLAWHETIPVQIARVHVGTDKREDFEIPEHIKNPQFPVEILSELSNASIIFESYEVDVDTDKVNVNGNLAGYVCKHEKKFRTSWVECIIDIPPEMFTPGQNTISFTSGKSQAVFAKPYDFDDYMIKNFYLLVEYKYVEPYLLENKAVIPNNTIIGTPAEIRISLTNVGIKPAKNVTIIDFVPLGARIINGSREQFIPTINLRETVTHRYTITALNPGKYHAPTGITYYKNNSGYVFRKNITATKLEYNIPKPKIIVDLTAEEKEIVVGKTVTFKLNVTNTGPGTVRNISFSSIPPLKAILVEGPAQMLERLSENQTITTNLLVRFTNTSQQIYRVYTYYNDATFRTHMEESNDLKINIIETPVGEKIFSQTTILVLIITAVATIIILLTILRYVNQQ